MRKIEIVNDLRLCFPQRSTEFDDGVEIGVAAALMAMGERRISRSLPPAAVLQLRALAQRLGYRVIEAEAEELVEVTLEPAALPPTLRVVR